MDNKNTEDRQPNIVIIIADDLGYGDVSMNGSQELSTPNIDRIASEGICLKDFHSNGAVCSPTRAALMTGCYQQRTGITGVLSAANHRDQGLCPESFTTYAKTLKEVGYQTALFGKWHLGYEPEFHPLQHGFDIFHGFTAGNIDYFSHIDQTGIFDWYQGAEKKDEKGYTTDLISAHGIRYIKEMAGQPFCLTLAHECPHYPYQGPGDEAFRTESPETINRRFFNMGPREDISEAYREMMECFDKGIGELLDTLEDVGELENTLVIFFSDNGPASPGTSHPFRAGKGSIYEGGHRVPACAMWPGHIKPGQTSHQTILTMDLFPTFCSMAGVETPKLDGVDLSGHLFQGADLEPRTTFWEMGGGKAVGVRKGDWKLNLNDDISELYNLNNDPSEKNNLGSENSELVIELKNDLQKWRDQVHTSGSSSREAVK
jgi:arylsulfatase A